MNLVFKVALAVVFSAFSLFAMGSGDAAQGAQKGMGKPMKGMFQSVPASQAELLMSGKDKEYCPNCGMYLPKFYKTSHAVRLKDGEVTQYCSIYCLVEQFEVTVHRGEKSKIDEIMVVDVPSLKFVDARKAYYVVGSSKAGTMTHTSKYAFKDEAAAKKFASENGGEVVDFNKAYMVALEDFAKDTALVYKNRSTKMYKMGEKLYNTQCDKEKVSSLDAHTMGMLKEMIKESKACGEGLNDKELQSIMLYYWDVKLDNFDKLYGKSESVQAEIKKLGLDK